MHCAMTYEFQFLREFGVFGVFSAQIIEVLKRNIGLLEQASNLSENHGISLKTLEKPDFGFKDFVHNMIEICYRTEQ